MIDVAREELFPLAEGAKHYPRRDGKRPSFCTVWRHATRGSHGIRLETVKLPSGLYTSREAVARFITALTVAHEADVSTTSQTPSPSRPRQPRRRNEDQRAKDIRAAEQRLAAAGI